MKYERIFSAITGKQIENATYCDMLVVYPLILTECYVKFKTQFIMKNQSQKFNNNNILTIENKSPETCFAPVFNKF